MHSWLIQALLLGGTLASFRCYRCHRSIFSRPAMANARFVHLQNSQVVVVTNKWDRGSIQKNLKGSHWVYCVFCKTRSNNSGALTSQEENVCDRPSAESKNLREKTRKQKQKTNKHKNKTPCFSFIIIDTCYLRACWYIELMHLTHRLWTTDFAVHGYFA